MPTTVQQQREALSAHADRLARYQRGEIPPESWRPIRLSYGLYYQLDHTSHMQRIKLPGGLLTAAQLDVMADIADRYGRGIGHVTTRQDIQIHWVPLEQVIDMYEELLAVDISTRGACADSVRNVTGCPYAGVHPDEPFDVAPHVLAIHDYFLFNPLNLTLPRKFKIAVEGCPEDCAQIPINDIGAYAKLRDGTRGFAIWAGGGLGAQPFLAKPVAEFIPADDLLIWCEAIVRVQHRHGERKNRSRARMKYVVKKMGLEKFRELIEEQVRVVDGERGAELRAELREQVARYQAPGLPPIPTSSVTPAAGFDAWRRTNVRRQRQDGYRSVVVQLPLGDITAGEMRDIAELVRTHGDGTLRATNDQNLVLPSIPEAALPAVHARLCAIGLGGDGAGTINDVVSCPGMDYCSLAITRSMGVAERVRAHLLDDPESGDDFAARLGRFTVKVSGCPNSCGQHHIGDIGLTGHSVSEGGGAERPYYSILVGGSVGEGRGRVGHRLGRYREEDTPAAIAALARHYEAGRQEGESFPAYVDRVGLKALAAVAVGAAEAHQAAAADDGAVGARARSA